MMVSRTNDSPYTQLLPRIDLTICGSEFLVTCGRGRDTSDSTEPFPLPKFKDGLLEWLMKLHYKFWEIRGKCMASVLLLDMSTKTWSSRIPHQQPAEDASVLRIIQADLVDVPATTMLAGSFQTLYETDPRNFSDVIPNFSGLHFLQVVQGQANGLWGFIRALDQCQIVTREQVVANDIEMMITANLRRPIMS